MVLFETAARCLWGVCRWDGGGESGGFGESREEFRPLQGLVGCVQRPGDPPESPSQGWVLQIMSVMYFGDGRKSGQSAQGVKTSR